jgi:hypothetical protein
MLRKVVPVIVDVQAPISGLGSADAKLVPPVISKSALTSTRKCRDMPGPVSSRERSCGWRAQQMLPPENERTSIEFFLSMINR